MWMEQRWKLDWHAQHTLCMPYDQPCEFNQGISACELCNWLCNGEVCRHFDSSPNDVGFGHAISSGFYIIRSHSRFQSPKCRQRTAIARIDKMFIMLCVYFLSTNSTNIQLFRSPCAGPVAGSIDGPINRFQIISVTLMPTHTLVTWPGRKICKLKFQTFGQWTHLLNRPRYKHSAWLHFKHPGISHLRKSFQCDALQHASDWLLLFSIYSVDWLLLFTYFNEHSSNLGHKLLHLHSLLWNATIRYHIVCMFGSQQQKTLCTSRFSLSICVRRFDR